MFLLTVGLLCPTGYCTFDVAVYAAGLQLVTGFYGFVVCRVKSRLLRVIHVVLATLAAVLCVLAGLVALE